MKNVTAGKAQESLPSLLDEIAVSHEPIQITSDSSSGILIAEEDWRAIQETVYLLSIPGMRKSIREGLTTPLEECVAELPW
jgi:PHD/YefM family antitoxin component YafN of YafNO toxin-antitoxin module